jgi:hypothetical protein
LLVPQAEYSFEKDILNHHYQFDPCNTRIIRVIGTINEKIDENTIKNGLRTLFKNISSELRKVLVITDGANFGVSQLVGEVFDEDFSQNENINLIGINKVENVFSENDWKQIGNLQVLVFLNLIN